MSQIMWCKFIFSEIWLFIIFLVKFYDWVFKNKKTLEKCEKGEGHFLKYLWLRFLYILWYVMVYNLTSFLHHIHTGNFSGCMWTVLAQDLVSIQILLCHTSHIMERKNRLRNSYLGWQQGHVLVPSPWQNLEQAGNQRNIRLMGV